MERMDSGFDESYSLRTAETEQPPTKRSSAAPTRPRKPARPSTEPKTKAKPQLMHTSSHGPASTQRSTRHRRQGSGAPQPRRKSTASTSSNSTKSPAIGNDSKPSSSRRTSCTLIDPSRPARHYRIKSTHTAPTTAMNADIDDVLALHFRSCSLFQNPSYQTSELLPNPNISTRNRDVDNHDPDFGVSQFHHAGEEDSAHHANTSSDADINDRDVGAESAFQKEPKNTVSAVEKTDATTIHWMSPSTRRHEYAKMDRANSGVRSLMRRVVPKCVSGPPPPRFFEEDKSDVGSVRRYRMDLLDDEDDEAGEKDEKREKNEKNASVLRYQERRMGPKMTKTARPNEKSMRRKRWACF